MSDTTPRDQLAALLADDWNPDRDPIATPEPVQVDALDATERGDGGFGSTGRA